MILLGKILLYILGSVLGLVVLALALIVLALLLPVQVRLTYTPKGFAVALKILWYQKQLVPQNESEKKRKVKKQKSEAAVSSSKAADAEKAVILKNKSSAEASKTLPGIKPTTQAAAEQQETAEKSTVKKAALQKASSETGAKSFAQTPKKENVSAAKQASEPMPTEDSEKSWSKVKNILSRLPHLLNMAGSFLKAILRSLQFRHIRVIVPITADRPDEVARKVGQSNAWFYSLAAALQNCLHLSWDEVRFVPDYKNEFGDKLLLEVLVCGCAFPLLIAGLKLFFGLKQENIL